jgi:hypothetical protein
VIQIHSEGPFQRKFVDPPTIRRSEEVICLADRGVTLRNFIAGRRFNRDSPRKEPMLDRVGLIHSPRPFVGIAFAPRANAGVDPPIVIVERGFAYHRPYHTGIVATSTGGVVTGTAAVITAAKCCGWRALSYAPRRWPDTFIPLSAMLCHHFRRRQGRIARRLHEEVFERPDGATIVSSVRFFFLVPFADVSFRTAMLRPPGTFRRP